MGMFRPKNPRLMVAGGGGATCRHSSSASAEGTGATRTPRSPASKARLTASDNLMLVPPLSPASDRRYINPLRFHQLACQTNNSARLATSTAADAAVMRSGRDGRRVLDSAPA